MQAISSELRQWIAEQQRAGCRPEDVIQAMQASGWAAATARQAWEATTGLALAPALPAESPPAASTAQAPSLAQAAGALPEPDLSDHPCVLDIEGHPVRVAMTLQLPRVVVFEGLLTAEECDALVAEAGPRMTRSQTVVYETGGNEVNAARTSDGMFFRRGETALCERIERRIAALLRWPVSHGEGLQVLHYRVGAQYKPHHDYFDPAQPGMAPVLARGGQRLATLVIYLNQPERGGATVFPDAGLTVAPIKGHAVFFSYDRPHAATLSLHGGAPVLAGEKWVATKWLREREFN